VALDPEYHWDFGSLDDAVHGWGTYAFATFVMVTPAEHAGRKLNVVFTCETESRLTPSLGEGSGHVYSLELPKEFLVGPHNTIEDCDFVPGVRWTCPDEEPGCSPPQTPTNGPPKRKRSRAARGGPVP
jgi:hypothetical protein